MCSCLKCIHCQHSPESNSAEWLLGSVAAYNQDYRVIKRHECMQLVSFERFPRYPKQLHMTDRYNNGPTGDSNSMYGRQRQHRRPLNFLMQPQMPVGRQCTWAPGRCNEQKNFLGALNVDLAFTNYKECLDTSHVNANTQASSIRHLDLELNLTLSISCHSHSSPVHFKNYFCTHPDSQNNWVHTLLQ